MAGADLVEDQGCPRSRHSVGPEAESPQPNPPTAVEGRVHELAIVDALIEQVRQEIGQAGAAGPVTRVELVVGRFSGVCPDSLRFAFEMLAPGTIVEGAELTLRQPPAIARCRACGAQTEIEDLAGTCPRCESPDVSLEGSRDLVLESIELEDHQDQTHEDRRRQEDPQGQ